MPRIRFASIRSIAAGAALTALAPVVQAQICSPFTDVALADGFCGSIQWMYNRGITLGCTTDQYCPAGSVRRDQMAAFIFRLGNVVHQQGGNSFAATAVLGTTDNHAIDVRANGNRVVRYEPNAISPNIIGGSASNAIAVGVAGAVIGGGGVGGAENLVFDAFGTVSGGYANRAGDATHPGTAGSATVGGGFDNAASGSWSVIAGGLSNVASGYASAVTGGVSNAATGPSSTVPGGESNVAAGTGSFAAGRNARANFPGCFVYADWSSLSPTSCFLGNEIVIRGVGGFYFWTAGTDDNTYSGARLAPGTGAWAAYSDVDGKGQIEPVNSAEILEKLLAMPVARWQWTAEPGNVKHIGPTAQDFRAAFGLGDSDKQIVTVDADGGSRPQAWCRSLSS